MHIHFTIALFSTRLETLKFYFTYFYFVSLCVVDGCIYVPVPQACLVILKVTGHQKQITDCDQLLCNQVRLTTDSNFCRKTIFLPPNMGQLQVWMQSHAAPHSFFLFKRKGYQGGTDLFGGGKRKDLHFHIEKKPTIIIKHSFKDNVKIS